ncbi:deoxyribonuclease 1 like 4, tandem duplicate 1 isoform X1 [Simochromis diagramma]|uniref:deoxyribonuclease 1 like 4, tandem duplicate 1 isoform X1 n=1 Tax=Simochromis diagramma TaxID=43689 RepID=UPI001A7ED33B|nr:deoxyribonuclease 1 like 4, tandem duplicate 1 isoform X1 [Simochromis diagramma]
MKIASFNIQKFGKKKVSDPNVLEILTKIVSRYDIILILEVVDASGESIEIFMKELNKVHEGYAYKISKRQGRTRYKEQFMFIYKSDVVTLVNHEQFNEEATTGKDVINRDPYILKLRCSNTVVEDLVMIPVHTKPTDSVEELDELYDVVKIIKTKWNTDNIMILGDFNADGSYVSNRDMKTIRIREDENFHWLIGDNVDTTTSTKNTNTYDRIVVYGDDMLNAVEPESAKAFNFTEEFNLDDEQALKVSDHYPVEVELKSIVETDERNAKKPKGKTPAYAFFVVDFYKEHKKKHPGAKVILTEVSKLCSEKWKSMSPEEKAKFEEMAKNDKRRYDQEMKSYVPPAGAKKGKKKKKDPNAPKKPPSAFLIFTSEQREKIKVDNPGISITDIAKKFGEMWKKMSTTDKAPYEAKYAKLKEKYEMEVAAYRAKGAKNVEPADDDDEDEDDEDEDDDDEDENDIDGKMAKSFLCLRM